MNYNNTSEPYDRRSNALIPGAASTPALREPYGPPGYPLGLGEAAEPTTLHLLLECWRILNKRKWLILSVALAFLVIGAVRTLMQTPLYTATVRLQIDAAVAKVVEGGNVAPEDSGYDFIRTQYELLSSRTMAERVASALKLGKDAEFFAPREFSLLGAIQGLLFPTPQAAKVNEKSMEEAAVGIILGNHSVRPVSGSRLVDVSYTDPNPGRAQRIANAYADAFVASNLDKRFQANASAKTFLEDKIAQLKLRLERSEQELVNFAKKEEIVAAQEKESIAESNLSTAHQVGFRTLESLRNQRNALELEYQEKLATFKPAYPAMVQTKTKIEELDRQIEAETEEMNSKVTGLKKQLLDLQQRSIQYNILKREVDTNRELYTSLLQRFKEVDIASGVGANNVFLVDRALPGAHSSPNLPRALMIALALGLAAGFGLAYVLERLDDKVRTVEQIEAVSGLPTLGVIPHVSNVREQLADLRSPLCEAYRSLCTALQFSTESGLPKSLTVTSSGPSEGKSLTSLSIAKYFASLGRKVLLIDGDMRNPCLHKLLDTENSRGLSNYLTGACTPPDVMLKTSVPSLAFIASGPLPPNAADLLGSPRLVSLLSIGAEVFDLIVIDGPPVLGLADAQLLSNAAAATIFVAAANSSRTGNIRGALKRLQLSQGSLLGVVLTKYDAKAARYGYGYGYGQGYGYDYSYGGTSETKGRQLQVADHRLPIVNLRKSA